MDGAASAAGREMTHLVKPTHGTIIVVDDVQAMRDLIIAFLRKVDDTFTLVAASTGLQALAIVESFTSLGPDPSERVIVISDLRMPGLDGITLLRNLAASPHDVQAILMTAFPDEGIHERARELGALACFEKPFDLDVLAAVVRDAVHGLEPRGATPRALG